MPQTDIRQGGLIISTNTAAAATVNLTLIGNAAGRCHRIKWITCFATSATVASVLVTMGDGTTVLAQVGGVGTGILNQPLFFGAGNDPSAGLVCKVNDATIVTMSTTAGNPVQLCVAYDLVAG